MKLARNLFLFIVFTCSVSLRSYAQHSFYDSLLHGMFSVPATIDTIKTQAYPLFPDAVYAEKIAKLNSSVPLSYNEDVRAFIEMYVTKKRNMVERMTGLAPFYFPMIEQVMREYGLPEDLKYMAIIESALNPVAISKAGAQGMWQFMYGTGKMYNLKMNSQVDERLDPYIATHAAARFLKDLYAKYGNWDLVIAAYNCGPGNVNRAIRLSGGKKDFASIKRFLPAETRSYVPIFMAAAYVMNHYKDHNIISEHFPYTIEDIDTMWITNNTSLEKICSYAKAPLKELTYFNPALKKGSIIASNSSPYCLKLPKKSLELLAKNKDSIRMSTTTISVISSEFKQPAISKTVVTNTTMTYKVRRGDNLGAIADKYSCSVQQLKKWNGLKGSTIQPGQRLKIKKEVKVKTYAEAKVVEPKEEAVVKTGISENTKKNISEPFVYYKVRSGDTLWSIAKKYPGVTIDSLQRTNRISDSKALKPGKVIKIEVKG